MPTDSTVIRVEHVTQRFRVIQERPDTLRELFAKFFRHANNYHNFEALKDVSFDVHRGEMVGLIGRNGSGKSTLLKIISGIYRPSEGKVTVHGSIAPLLELGAGFHYELTGRENIILSGLLMGYSKKEMAVREESIIQFAEIGEFIDAPVKQYSSGMYIRLAFAVATEIDPDILVIDEILAVGDVGFQQKCFERLHHYRKQNKTILFVSHSPTQVLDLCDRVILIDKGEIAFDGDPARGVELYSAQAAAALPAPATPV
jgi:ABC-2 type transport system ATP-binding protein/lipopolysaccharide transport system ATP-binding protein